MATETTEHTTSIRVMEPSKGYLIFAAECSCGWESVNLCSHRRQASDDARRHRNEEASWAS